MDKIQYATYALLSHRSASLIRATLGSSGWLHTWVRGVQCEEKRNGITGKEDLWRKDRSLETSEGIEEKECHVPFVFFFFPFWSWALPKMSAKGSVKKPLNSSRKKLPCTDFVQRI